MTRYCLLVVAALTTVTVEVPSANLFKEPVAYLGTVATVTQGTALDVIEERGRWLRVRTPDGQEGWFLSPRANLPDAPPGCDRRYLSATAVAKVGAGLVTKGLVREFSGRDGASAMDADRTAEALEAQRFGAARIEGFAAEAGLVRLEE